MQYWRKHFVAQHSAALVYNTGRPIQFVLEKVRDGQLCPVEFVIANQGQNIYCNGKMWQPWVEHMRTCKFTIKLVDHVEELLRSVDVSPCTLTVDRHDFSLRFWIAGGESWLQCADRYRQVCLSVDSFPGCWLWTYSKDEIEKEFTKDDGWKHGGLGCELYCDRLKGSKAPGAQFLLRWFDQQSNDAVPVQAIWAGDGWNDEGMLSTGWKGIIPVNGVDELKEAARQNANGGYTFLSTLPTEEAVVEGLQFLTSIDPP